MNDITLAAIGYIASWFNFKLYPSQEQIADFFFNPKTKRKATIKATTRYGKSQVIALCCIIYAIFYPKVKIGIIAPTNDKTKIIMSYIQTALSSCSEMTNAIDLDLMDLSKLERLKREISKRKITFKNGSSIEVLSPDIKGKGFGAMGRAFDLTVIDETAEIPDEVYAKIYRMLVESPTSKLIEIGNPWHLNHFYDHHNSDDWEKYTINSDTAIKEGRMTQEAVDDQKKNLTELEFQVLFGAEFPKDIEFAIFTQDGHINKAIKTKEFNEYDKILVGIDTAQGGKDYTVFTFVLELDGEFSFYDSVKLDLKDDMRIVGQFLEYFDLQDWNKEDLTIGVDYPMGSGTANRLKEHGFKVFEFRSGFSAVHKKRFSNLKAESVFGLADIMKQGRFFNLPANSEYTLQLKKWIMEIRSDRLIKVIDPKDKSPDEVDSLMIALSKPKNTFTAFSLETL